MNTVNFQLILRRGYQMTVTNGGYMVVVESFQCSEDLANVSGDVTNIYR